MSFSCLVGVALNNQTEPDGGNFTVLRGSHIANAAFFAQQAAAHDCRAKRSLARVGRARSVMNAVIRI